MKSVVEELHVTLILAGLDPGLEPYKAQVLNGEVLPTLKNTFGHFNSLFLRQSSVVPSNDSSALMLLVLVAEFIILTEIKTINCSR